MRPRRRVEPPRLTPVELHDLRSGDLDALVPRADLDGLAIADAHAESADCSHALVTECAFTRVDVASLHAEGTRWRQSSFHGVGLTQVSAARGDWREVTLEDCRIGSLDASSSSWSDVHATASKITYASFMMGKLTDVALTQCTIDELDLTGATVTRMSVEGSRIAHLVVSDATLAHADLRGSEIHQITRAECLRGAVVSSDQLMQLAPLLAASWGLTVED